MVRLDRTAGCVATRIIPAQYYLFDLVYQISGRADFSRTVLRVWTGWAGAVGPGGLTYLAEDALGSARAGAGRRKPKPHRDRTEPVRGWARATAGAGPEPDLGSSLASHAD